MNLQIVGCSHHSSSIEIRERLAMSPDQTEDFLRRFQQEFPLTEAVLLSTCNRTELYTAGTTAVHLPRLHQMQTFLAEGCGLRPDQLQQHLFAHHDELAIRHLFSVAASLDSMVVGETQILSQVKRAYQLSTDMFRSLPMTHMAFQAAIRVARRIANETRIHASRVSVPSIAICVFARQIFERLDNKRILVVGAGEMARETLNYVREQGGTDIVIVNRSASAADQLARDFGGTTVPWPDLTRQLALADLVVSTTGSAHPVITLSMYRQIERARDQRPLFLLDLAVPRDIEAAIGECLNVYLYTIDDLQQECERNRKARSSEWPKAQTILEQETRKFMIELEHRRKGPTIEQLKNQAHRIKDSELTRLMNRLGDVDPDHRREIETSLHRVVNKILHPPLESLRDESESGSSGLLDALRRLFRLED